MRSEAEMLGLILNYARGNDDVRAVIMNGSRVNPNAPKDRFQDYDIVYFVRNVEPYRRNPEVVRYFGDIMILQMPDDMGDPPPEKDGGYGYLMQFLDGNRTDLGFYPLEDARRRVEDTLTVVLLDKDQMIGELPPPSDLSYLPKTPTAKAFEDCCNEFWWVTPYVAKGLWRGELTYAKHMLDVVVREELMKMLVWYAGTKTKFRRSPGKLGKYLKGQIEDDLWVALERTYADAHPDSNWEALFTMGDLFRRVARSVASAFGFCYPDREDRNVSEYIRFIRTLPRTVKTMDTILPSIRSILQSTSARWLNLTERVAPDLLARPPAPGEWSALACLQHLVDTERWVFPARVRFLLAGQDFPAFDPDSQGTQPAVDLHPADLAAEFARLRSDSLRVLENVTPSDLPRQALHQELGMVSLSELLHEWAAHDLMHTVQAERALMQPFIQGCGPWQPYFEDHVAQG